MVQFIIPCDIARLKCLYFFLLLMSEYGFGRVRRVLHAACCGFYAAGDYYFFSLFFFLGFQYPTESCKYFPRISNCHEEREKS